MATKRKREERKSRMDFTGVDPERRQKEHKSGFDRTAILLPENMEMFKLSKGNHRIDIVPYIVGEGNPHADEGQPYYERTYFRHPGVGSGEDVYICSNQTFKEKCPICEYRAKAANKGTLDKDSLKDLAPKERQLFNVFDHGDPDKGVQLWEVSFHNFGKLLDERVKNRDEDEDFIKFWWFSDVKRKGCTLKIMVTEETMGEVKFNKVTVIDFKPRKAPLDDDILEQVACLDELMVHTPYEKLKAIFLQNDEDENENENDNDNENDKPKAKKGKAKKPPVEEEWDEDETEDEEEGELAPLPTEKAILKMDRDSLIELIEDYGLDIDPDKYKRTGMLAKKVAEAAALYEESDEEAEEEWDEEAESEEEEWDEEETEEAEDEDWDEESEDEDLEDFDEEDEEDEEWDEDEELEDFDDFEEEPAPKKKPATKKKTVAKKTPAKKAPAKKGRKGKK